MNFSFQKNIYRTRRIFLLFGIREERMKPYPRGLDYMRKKGDSNIIK